jgi:hypothetical protein
MFLAVLAISSTALSQEEPGGLSSPTYPNSTNEQSGRNVRYSIGGTVINSATGEPVMRALVSVEGEHYAMTDSNGRFRIDALPPGQVSLNAEKPGFFNPAQMESVEEPRTRVSLTADVGDVVLKLMPQAVVAGRITAIAGGPIEDFPVRLYARRIADGRAQWQSAGTTQTDEDGYFRIADLRPGQYCLSAGPERTHTAAAGAHLRGYATVFFPHAPDLSSAGMIELSPGEQFAADFALSQEPLYEISGQVLGAPSGEGVGWALFDSSLEHLDALRFRPERQQFVAYVPAGRYTLRFFARMENQQLAATVPFTVAGNMSGIKAVLAPEISIPVNIRVESNAPRTEQSTLQLTAGASYLQAAVRLRPLPGGLDQNEYSSAPVQRGGGGSYIVGAPPGTYAVEVQTWGGKYVQSASSGSTDLLREPLMIAAGAKVDPIDVVLRDDGGHVSGTLQGQRSAAVVLIPERGPVDDAQMIPAQGSFEFAQVRPGDYFVLAFDRAEGLEYKNADALAPYLSRAAHVTVAARQGVKVNLEVIQMEKH